MTDLRTYGTCTLDQDGCSTCGDTGIPVRVLALTAQGEADCEDLNGQHAHIAIDLTPGVLPGDVLIVHMGVAIAHIPQQNA